MSTQIESILVKNLLWATANERFLSFRFTGFKRDIHFTVAYNKASSDVNLHVTKNNGSKGNKPKIEILRISKDDLNELIENIGICILNAILIPLPLKSKRRKSRHSYYGVFFSPILNSPSIERHIKKEFKAVTKRRGKKIEFQENIESTFSRLAENEKYKDAILKGLRFLPRKLSENTAGYIHSKKYSGIAISINGKWYTIKRDISLPELLAPIMDMRLTKHLIFKTLLAYARIQNLTTREQAQRYEYSMPLFKIDRH